MLSRDNIRQAMAEGHLRIFPFEEKNLTGIGYNISTTDFAFSTNQGILLTIHQKTNDQGVMRYVVIPPNDTVLFFSREYIEVDNTLAGTFHSKVSCVSQGLGHISTTLDPTWKGQLLLSVNNPTTHEVIFDLKKNGGNIMTLLLYQMDAAVTGGNIHDNNKGRCELLVSHFAKPSSEKFRERHLELKKFVQDELADSLNGYDSFLGPDQPQDRYSSKVQRLQILHERLERDRLLISEDRYKLGTQGIYHCLNNEEKKMILDCTLFEACSATQSKPDITQIIKDGFTASQLRSVGSMIEKCIEIIDYELNMIDHIRRIQWQNTRIQAFAGEDSEFVSMRQSAEKKAKLRRIWLPLGCLILTTLIFIVSLLTLECFQKNPHLQTIAIAIYVPIFVVVVEGWQLYWRK